MSWPGFAGPMLRPETRTRARALQLLYAWETGGRQPVASLSPGLAGLIGPAPRLPQGAAARGEVLAAAVELAEGVLGDLNEIDRLCADASEHWRLDRVAAIERNLLRLGTYELLRQAAPPKVVIDQALWLAHRFGGPQSAAFVNGVLDRIARTLGRL